MSDPNQQPQSPVQVNNTINISESELRRIVQEAVKETLTTIGVDHQDPFEMQRDFQHLREWRKSSEAIQKKGLLTLVGIFITGTVALIWMGLTDKLGGG